MNRYNYLRHQQRCVQCGKKDERTEDGYARCSECRKSYNEYARKYYTKNKGKDKEARRNYGRDRYKYLVSLGLCASCGKEKAQEGRRYCAACAKKFTEYGKKSYEEKKSSLWRKINHMKVGV